MEAAIVSMDAGIPHLGVHWHWICEEGVMRSVIRSWVT